MIFSMNNADLLPFTSHLTLNGKIKGLVHPKMKIKSLITHPHAVPTP